MRLRIVQIGRNFGAGLQVLSGIGPSDRVIDNPPGSLSEGETVRVIDAKGGE